MNDVPTTDDPVWIVPGDCREAMAALPEGCVDAVVCDPPYGLEYLGKEWDHGVPGVPFWSAALRVLKPGGYLLAFGGTRTYHRLACAIEDAGFEVRDCLNWLYGTGYPKGQGCLKPAYEPVLLARKPLEFQGENAIIVESLSTLETQLWSLLPADIAAGCSTNTTAARTGGLSSALPVAGAPPVSLGDLSGLMGTSQFASAVLTCLNIASSWKNTLAAASDAPSTSTTETGIRPTTDWRTLNSCLLVLTPQSIIRAEMQAPGYGLNALPAARYLNAVCLSIESTRELSALASAISAARTSPLDADATSRSPAWEPILLARRPGKRVLPLGIEECRVGTGDDRTSGGATGKRVSADEGYSGDWADADNGRDRPAGGRWPANVVLDGSDEVLAAFAEYGEKNVCARSANRGAIGYGGRGEAHHDPDGAHGYGVPGKVDRGTAARFFYTAKASKKERGEGNTHPTVKPLALMQWLVKMVAAPGGLVLDPFGGSGTTAVACVMEGRRAILIEREPTYVEIALKRVNEAEQSYKASYSTSTPSEVAGP